MKITQIVQTLVLASPLFVMAIYTEQAVEILGSGIWMVIAMCLAVIHRIDTVHKRRKVPTLTNVIEPISPRKRQDVQMKHLWYQLNVNVGPDNEFRGDMSNVVDLYHTQETFACVGIAMDARNYGRHLLKRTDQGWTLGGVFLGLTISQAYRNLVRYW